LLGKIDYLGVMSIHEPIAGDETPPSGVRDTITEKEFVDPKGRPQEPASPPLDPTRFGDWERAGRCIDF